MLNRTIYPNRFLVFNSYVIPFSIPINFVSLLYVYPISQKVSRLNRLIFQLLPKFDSIEWECVQRIIILRTTKKRWRFINTFVHVGSTISRPCGVEYPKCFLFFFRLYFMEAKEKLPSKTIISKTNDKTFPLIQTQTSKQSGLFTFVLIYRSHAQCSNNIWVSISKSKNKQNI